MTPTRTLKSVLSAGFGRRAREVVALWRRNRRTRRQLSLLPPGRLRDVGLTPQDARCEAQRPFWMS